MPFCAKTRAFILERYFESKSYKAVQEAFRNEYPGQSPPNKSTIKRLVDNFRENCTVESRKRNRKKSTLTPEKISKISEVIESQPSVSVRKLALQTDTKPTSVFRAIKTLKLRSYGAIMVQELLPADPAQRLQFCRSFLQFYRCNGCTDWLNNVFFSDEAWFHKTGYINAKNYRIWSTENPKVFRQKSLHPEKIGVWCAISRQRIVGPIFFESTVNAEKYREIITDFIALLEPSERDCWFQQDGAPAHTAAETMDFLSSFFHDRLISKGATLPWPPRSPDLSPPDFFLWGHLKNKVFQTHIESIDHLKRRITEEINAITPETLKRVSKNLLKRVKTCRNEAGGHFQQYL